MNPFHKKYIKTYVAPTEAPDIIDDETKSAVTTFSSNKIVSIASGHIYQCSTAAATASKEITVTDMEISSNVTFEIFFANGNSADNMTVSINGETGKALKIWSGGSKKSVPKDIDAGVTLRVFDDGTDFIVLGNPVISSTSSYTIYADGTNVYPTSQVYKKSETYTQTQINNALANKSGVLLYSSISGDVSTKTITINFSKSFLYYESLSFLIIGRRENCCIATVYYDGSSYSGHCININGSASFAGATSSTIKINITQWANYNRFAIIPLGNTYLTDVD